MHSLLYVCDDKLLLLVMMIVYMLIDIVCCCYDDCLPAYWYSMLWIRLWCNSLLSMNYLQLIYELMWVMIMMDNDY